MKRVKDFPGKDFKMPSMNIRLWIACSVIAAWQLIASPRFPWTENAVWFGILCFGGSVVCIFWASSRLRIGYEKNSTEYRIETLVMAAFILYVPVYHLAQHPVQVMEPRYVVLELGNDRMSRIYRIGSGPSEIVEPERKDDGYRELYCFTFWQTAKAEGFRPSARDIPHGKNFPMWLCVAIAFFERAVGNFTHWLLVSAGLGIFFCGADGLKRIRLGKTEKK
jgi:hypothetical protein